MLSATPRSGPRACRTCAIVKAKCVWDYEGRESSTKCKRCNRLKKECTLQTPARRGRKPPKKTRISQIEEKIDTLSSMLQNSNTGSQQAAGFSETPLASKAGPTKDETTSSNPYDASNGSNLPSAGDEEELIRFYRVEMTPQFPFVVVPSNMSAKELARERPFMHRCILMASSLENLTVQTVRTEEAVAYMAEHILIRGEKSLDLLQGLLIFLGWFHKTLNTGRRLMAVLSLATAMMVDIRINGEPDVVKAEGSVKWALKSYAEPGPERAERTLEERRAYLGVYYLTSVLSVYFLYMDAPRSTAYVESCLRILAREEGRVGSDEYLIQLIHLQTIAQEMSEARGDAGHLDDSLVREAIPLAVVVKTLQKKLERFRSELPAAFKTDPILLMHYHSILIYLTEIGLSVPLPSRQATLHVCLSSIHSFLAALFSIPRQENFKITYVSWIHLLYAIPVLSKLSQFESDDWDPSHVRGVVDVSLVLEGLIWGLEKHLEIHEARNKDSSHATAMYVTVLRRFKQFKEAFEQKRDELEAAWSSDQSPASLPNLQPGFALSASSSHSESHANSQFTPSPSVTNATFQNSSYNPLTSSADRALTPPSLSHAASGPVRAQKEGVEHQRQQLTQDADGNSNRNDDDNDDIGIMFDSPYDAFWEEMMQDFSAPNPLNSMGSNAGLHGSSLWGGRMTGAYTNERGANETGPSSSSMGQWLVPPTTATSVAAARAGTDKAASMSATSMPVAMEMDLEGVGTGGTGWTGLFNPALHPNRILNSNASASASANANTHSQPQM